MIQKWINKLGLTDWDITTEAISDEQVVYPDDISDEDRFFIGVRISPDDYKAVIYHSRVLVEEDIVHELLHVANPDKGEEWIERMTNLQMEYGN